MSPGKRSPVIRTGLFLTGDQSQYGGKGEPSKTGVQSTLLLVPPNCAALVRGTGDFVSPQRCVFIVPPDSTSFRRGTGGFICQRFRQRGLRGASRYSRYSRYNPVNWQHGKSCLPAIRTTQREQARIRDCNNLHRVWGPHWADRRSESGRMLQNRQRSEK